MLNEEVYQLPRIFPLNYPSLAITISDLAYRAPAPSALMTDSIPDLHLLAAIDAHKCFSLMTVDHSGNSQSNIRLSALKSFRTKTGLSKLSPEQLFNYVYAILHHPGYRAKFAHNLQLELPRIPFAPDFAAFAKIGAELAQLHVNYETVTPYPLDYVTNPAHPASYKVEDKMRWLDKDKTKLQVNPNLTLAGIPASAHDYILGSRSALDWIVEMYQVSEDKRTGIRQDPNRPDDPEYIVNLIARIVTVSLRTNDLVSSLALLPYA